MRISAFVTTGRAAHVRAGVFVRHVYADETAPSGQLQRAGMTPPA